MFLRIHTYNMNSITSVNTLIVFMLNLKQIEIIVKTSENGTFVQ